MTRDLVFGRTFAALVGSMLLSVLAYNFVKNQKKSPRRPANDRGASSSRTPSTGSNNYDVFLSFCGMDVRHRFGDHLYEKLVGDGIWVFRDDDELCEGDDIGTSLRQAIKNSKISIPILSSNYGSRKWCLEELVEMIKHRKSGGHVVLPIFYEVEPAHVRFQKEDFGTTFSQFSNKYIVKDVEEWKDALQEVGSIKGWVIEKTPNSGEGELLKSVVTRVLSELNALQMDVTNQLVGIDDAVDAILRLLDNNSNATQIVGIHGMGGIGKTTLAKVVFNKLSDQFLYRSFLADIRQSSKQKGILCLQSQLIYDITKRKDRLSNMEEGIKIMKSGYKFKKVLILLDDVDETDQLKDLLREHELFEMGSRIIVTTRKSSVLDEAEVNCKYELEEITEDQSLILFSRHAFGSDSPPCEFRPLARDVVSTTGRLPLALKVLGSLLRRKDQAFWQGALKKLRKVPNDLVQAKLRISFEALNEHQKQIFLDIACFLIGTDKRIAFYMWDARDFFPGMEVEMLRFMSLIKVGDNHELKMHDQLRDLGREIASEGLLVNRSRLWVHDKALEVLQRSKEENEYIEALRLDKDDSRKFMEQYIFRKLPNLQFLHLSEVDFAGDFKQSLSKLCWLKWERCPNSFKATNVHLKKLLILDLSGGFISEKWEGWKSIKMERLKVLNLSGCSHLESTHCLSGFTSLERLILENCENLEKIHPSIGDFKCLVSLNLRYCESLKNLPAQLGGLRKLEELLLDETDIEEIPTCIQFLTELKMLSAVGCRLLTRVPSSISNLVNLLTLNLNTCKKLQELPDSFEALKKLQHLLLVRCYMLEQIPSSIGELGELVELDLSSTGIKELPVSIGKLNKLKILRISYSEIEKLPRAIGELESLQEFSASGCHNLEGQIPVDLGGLSSLRTLRLGRAKISRLPENFHKLSNLEHLDLLYCSELESPTQFPFRLSSLQLTCRSETLPSLSHLEHLKELTLRFCSSLKSIPELPSCIRKLRVWKCPKLERLSNLPKLNSLSELELLQCYGLKELDGLETLKSLRKLDVSTSTELSNLDDFEDLESLRYLDLQSYDVKEDYLREIPGLGQLKSLEVLNISGRKHIRQQPELLNLEHLIVNN